MMNDLLSRLQEELLFSDEIAIALEDPADKTLRIRLVEAVVHSCPASFFIAIAANDARDPAWMRAWGVAGGRSLERETAKLAAVLEAIERACLFHGGADDPRVHAEALMQNRHYCATDLMQLSSGQLRTIRAKRKFIATSGCGLAVDNLWMSGSVLTTGEAVEVPAAVVLFPDRPPDGPILASSSGAAVRDTRDGAVEHGVLELVERDAVAVWWYNCLIAARLPAEESISGLPGAVSFYLSERPRITWHLALDTDLPAHVVVAVSCRADGSRPALGAAAALTREAAVTAATLEMMQVEIALGQMRAAANLPDVEPQPLLAWSDATNALATPYLLGRPSEGPPKGPSTFDALRDALAAGGIEVAIVDLTRPDIGLPVVRAVSPHLRDWLPRFGPGRLYDLPVRLGLREAPLAEADLNVPFVL